MTSLQEFAAANPSADPAETLRKYRNQMHLDLLKSGEYDEKAPEVDNLLKEFATEGGIEIDFNTRDDKRDLRYVSQYSEDEAARSAARTYLAVDDEEIRTIYDDPVKYDEVLTGAKVAAQQAITPVELNRARRMALDSGDTPFAVFQDPTSGEERIDVSPSMAALANNDEALAAYFEANPDLDVSRIGEIRQKLRTPEGYNAPAFQIDRQNDWLTAFGKVAQQDENIARKLTDLRAAADKGAPINEALVDQIDTELGAYGMHGDVSPQAATERKSFIKDFINMSAAPEVDTENLDNNIRTLSTGQRVLPMSVMLQRPLFDKVVESPTIPEAQRQQLRATRDSQLSAMAPEMFKTIAANRSEFPRFMQERKDQGQSNAQILDEWMSNPDNYSQARTMLGGVGESILEGFGGLALYPAAMAGNESARKALADLQKSDMDRRNYAQMFGKNLGAGYDLTRLVAPVAADISVSLLTGGAATAAVGSKNIFRAGLKATLGSALRAETKGAISAFTRGAAARTLGRSAAEGGMATGAREFAQTAVQLLPVDDVLKLAGQDIAQKFVTTANTASYLATAFNRSAGSTYVQLYSQLSEEKNPNGSPKYTPEKAREIALNHGLFQGTITAGLTAAFSLAGKAGLESIYNGMSRKQLNAVFNKVKEDFSKLAPSVRAELNVTNLDEFVTSVAKKAVRPLFSEVAKDAGNEAAEEALDQFAGYFNQQIATGEKINIADAVKQAAYAGMLGGIMGGTVVGIREATSGVGAPDAQALAQRTALYDIAARLDAAQSPRTAAAVRQFAVSGIPTTPEKSVPEGTAAAGTEQAPGDAGVAPVNEAEVESRITIKPDGTVVGRTEAGTTEIKSSEGQAKDIESVKDIVRSSLQLAAQQKAARETAPADVSINPEGAVDVQAEVVSKEGEAGAAVAGFAKGLTQGLYQGMYDRLTQGKYPEPMKNPTADLVARQHSQKPFQSPEEIKAFLAENEDAQKRHEERKKLIEQNMTRFNVVKPSAPEDVRAEISTNETPLTDEQQGERFVSNDQTQLEPVDNTQGGVLVSSERSASPTPSIDANSGEDMQPSPDQAVEGEPSREEYAALLLKNRKEELATAKKELTAQVKEYGSKGERHPASKQMGGLNPAAQKIQGLRGRIAELTRLTTEGATAVEKPSITPISGINPKKAKDGLVYDAKFQGRSAQIGKDRTGWYVVTPELDVVTEGHKTPALALKAWAATTPQVTTSAPTGSNELPISTTQKVTTPQPGDIVTFTSAAPPLGPTQGKLVEYQGRLVPEVGGTKYPNATIVETVAPEETGLTEIDLAPTLAAAAVDLTEDERMTVEVAKIDPGMQEATLIEDEDAEQAFRDTAQRGNPGVDIANMETADIAMLRLAENAPNVSTVLAAEKPAAPDTDTLRRSKQLAHFGVNFESMLDEARALWKTEKEWRYNKLNTLKENISMLLMNKLNNTNGDQMAKDLIEGKPTLFDKILSYKPIKESELKAVGMRGSGITQFGYERGDRAVYRHPKGDQPDTRLQPSAPPTTRVTAELDQFGGIEDITAFLSNVAKKGKPEHRALAKFLMNFPAPPVVLVNTPNGPFAGAYVVKSGQVLINSAVRGPRGAVDTVLHELVHAATEDSINNPTPEQAKVLKRIDRIREATRKKAEKAGADHLLYGLGSNSEFFTHFLTSPQFQREVAALTPKGEKNLLQVILDAIVDLLNGRVRTQSERISSEILSDMVTFMQSSADARFGRHVKGQDGSILMLPAWHGTPHKIIGGFDLSRMGTGEGAQAFGWGFYFAQDVGVAKGYAKTLAKQKVIQAVSFGGLSPEQIDAKGLSNLTDVEVIQSIQKWGGTLQRMTSDEARKTGIEWAKLYKATPSEAARIGDIAARFDEVTTGNLYTVDLTVDEDEWLLWDRPLSEQSEKVKGFFRDSGINAGTIDEDGKKLYERSARRAYMNRYGERLDPMENPFSALQDNGKSASKLLNDAGIKGIKFLDGNSRNRPFKEIKKSFLDALPENAEIEDVQIAVKEGAFTPEQVTFLKALEADDYLGFEYPAQAISAALSDKIGNWDPSKELIDSIETLRGNATYNYVVFDPVNIKITHENGKPVTPEEASHDPRDTSRMGQLLMQPADVRNFTRFHELTRGVTPENVETWKTENPEKYEELVRMRERVLGDAGWTIESAHGTNGDEFTVFDLGRGGDKTAADSAALGIFTTDNMNVAEMYASNMGMGGAMALAFGSENNPLVRARNEALASPEGVRLSEALASARQNVQDVWKAEFEKLKQEYYVKLQDAKSQGALSDIDDAMLERMVEITAQSQFTQSNAANENPNIVAAYRAETEAENALHAYVRPIIDAAIPNKRVMKLRLKMENPAIFDAQGQTPGTFPLTVKIEQAIAEGRDGVVFENIVDPDESATHYVVFNPDQIKSAEPLNFDDNNQLIPPTEWANEASPDIRFQPAFNEEVQKYVTGNWPADAEGRYAELKRFVSAWVDRYPVKGTNDTRTDLRSELLEGNGRGEGGANALQDTRGVDGFVDGTGAKKNTQTGSGVSDVGSERDITQEDNEARSDGGDAQPGWQPTVVVQWPGFDDSRTGDDSRVDFVGRGNVQVVVGDKAALVAARNPSITEIEAKTFMAAEINEELIHAAHVEAVRRRTGATDLADAMLNETLTTAMDIITSARGTQMENAVRSVLIASSDLYSKGKNAEDFRNDPLGEMERYVSRDPLKAYRAVTEMVRQVIQLKRTGVITEGAFPRMWEKVKQWFSDRFTAISLLSQKPGILGQRFTQEVQETEAALSELGIQFQPAASEQPHSLSLVRATAEGFTPEGMTLDIDYDRLTEATRDLSPVNRENLIAATVNRAVSMKAGFDALGEDVTPDEVDRLTRMHEMTVSGNMLDSDIGFYRSNPTAMQRLVRFLTAAVKAMYQRLKLRFDYRTSVYVDRISRELSKARDGYRTRGGRKRFNPEEADVRMQMGEDAGPSRVIRLGSVSPRFRAAAEDIREALGEPVGFEGDNDRRIVTPSGVQLEISSFGNFVMLDSILTPSSDRGSGKASQAMTDLVALADQMNVPVKLMAVPFSKQPGSLNQQQLVSWYKKFGFQLQPNGETMIRQPLAPNVRMQMGETQDSMHHAELEQKFNDGTITDAEMMEAEAIVERAAKAAGYDVGPVYHGTDKLRNIFDPSLRQTGALKESLFFTSNQTLANKYALQAAARSLTLPYQNEVDRVLESTTRTKSELNTARDMLKAVEVVSEDILNYGFVRQSTYKQIVDWHSERKMQEEENAEDGIGPFSDLPPLPSIQELDVRGSVGSYYLNSKGGVKEYQADSRPWNRTVLGVGDSNKEFSDTNMLKVSNVLDSPDASDYGYMGSGESGFIEEVNETVLGDVYVVRESSQAKSADPFTGVPLSQRFNPDSPDIRFQLPEPDFDNQEFTAWTEVDVGNKLFSTDPNQKPRNWFGRMFGQRDDTRDPTSFSRVSKEALQAAMELTIDRRTKQYHKAIKAENPDIGITNSAIGSTAPILTEKDEKEIQEEMDRRNTAASQVAAPLIKAAQATRRKDLRNAVTPEDEDGVQATYEMEVEKAKAAQAAAFDAAAEWERREMRRRAMANAERLREESSNALAYLQANHPMTYEWAQAMRKTIDEFQTKVAKHYKTSRPELAWTIDNSRGVYLVRTFQFHQDPAFQERLLKGTDPEAVALRERGTEFFLKPLAEDKLAEMRKDPSYANFDEENLKIRARQEVAAQAKGLYEDWVMSRDRGNAVPGSGLRDIRTEFQRFMKKKNMPPEILEMLGEIKDPLFNSTRTLASLSNILFSQRMLTQIREDGLKNGYLVTAQTKAADPVKYSDWEALVAKDEHSQAYAPLAGLYASPKDKEAFNAAFNMSAANAKDTAEKASSFINRAIIGAAGTSMGVMVLGNVGSYSRNMVGTSIIALAAGINPLSRDTLKSMGIVRRKTFGKNVDADVQELIARRIIGDGANITYLRELLQKYRKDPFNALEWAREQGLQIDEKAVEILNKAGGGWTKMVDFLSNASEFSETFLNPLIYFQERDVLLEAGYHEEAAAQEAARRVKMLTPSKTEASQAVTAMTKSPLSALIAPFIRFKAEMLRTTWNTYKLAVQDMRSDNEVIREHGRYRLATAASVHAGITVMLPLLVQALVGITDDEDEAIRQGMPSYSRHSTFLYKRNEDGTIRTFDLTFANPFSFVFDSATQAFKAVRRDDLTEIPAIATRFVTSELLGEQIVAGKVMDVARNIDESSGLPIYFDTDGMVDRFTKSAMHVIEGSYVPQVAKKSLQAGKALYRPESDEEPFLYTPIGILVGHVAPVKPRDHKPEDLAYRAFRNAQKANAQLWQITNPLSSPAPMAPGAATEIYEERKRAGIKVWQDVYKLAKAYESLGIPAHTVAKQAIEAGLSKKRVGLAMEGYAERPVLSTDKYQDIEKIDPRRNEEIRQAIRRTPVLIRVD